MFKKLKEKIAEEVKPLKISQFAQSVVTPGNNAVVESTPNEPFSLDDELPEDSFGNEGFSVVDLHHPSLPVPLSSGRFSRQSSMSSLASDASAFLPIHDASIGSFNMQDLESASEREDVLPQMNNLSKQELCNSYLKLYRHYQKYKGRATDLKNFCRELEKDNKKHKTVLLECQEKSLRRIAELKEQCALEQHAKAHLEEALRNDLEEKDHLIQTLQTKIKLLKDAHSVNSSALIQVEDDDLLLIPGEIGEGSKGDLLMKDDSQTQQEPLNETLSKMKLESSCEETEIMALKNMFKDLKAQILKYSSVYTEDLDMKVEFEDVLNEISECLGKKITSSSSLLYEQKRDSSEAVDKNLHDSETDEIKSNLLLLDELEQNLSESEGQSPKGTHLNSTAALENTQNFVHIAEQGTCKKMEGSADAYLTGDLAELKNELTDLKNKFEKATLELEESHQLISEQNSTITKLNEKLITLQGEFATYNEENFETIKSELMQTKQELERVQQQVHFAQQTIEEKDRLIKETKDTLEKNHQELDSVLAQKTEMATMLTLVQSELRDTKSSSEELAHKILKANEEALKKESMIDHLNKEIENVRKELELVISENNEKDKMVGSLEIALTEMILKYEQTSKELELKSKSIEEKDLIVDTIKRDLSDLQKDLEMVSSKKDEGDNMVSALQTELKDINHRFEETTKELQSFHVLLKEKDDLIDKTKEELSLVRQELDAASHEKVHATTLLQNQLTDAHLQLEKMSEELLSAQQSIDSKDSDIVNVRACLESVKGDMETVLTRANQMIDTHQNELRESKAQTEELTQKLDNANKSIDEKDNEIVNIRQNIESIKIEMETVSSQNVEKSKMIKELENDLTDAKVQLGKVTHENDCFHKLIQEKDLTITSVNDELAVVLKNLEITLSQKTEANEMRTSLQEKLADVNGRLELLTKDLQSSQNLLHEKDANYAEVCEKLSDICKELDKTASEKAEAEDKVANLEKELINMSANYKELIDELQSSSKLLEERDLKIACLTEDAASIRETLNKMCAEKEEFHEKLFSLKKELTTTKLQFEQVSQEMQSAYHVTKEKDLAISHLTEKVENLRKDLDIISLQKVEACGLLKDLQDELKEASLNFEHVCQELQEVRESIEKKDLIIANLTTDLTNTGNELTSTSALKEESCELAASLQNELKDSKLCCDKVSEELEATHKLLEEKDMYIEQLKIDLVRVQEELNKTRDLNSEANKNIETLQSQLKTNLERISSECETSDQVLEEKKLESHVTENVEESTTSLCREETPELLSQLQRKLESSEQELENMVVELQTSQRRIEERDILIKKLEQELVDVQKTITSGNEDNTDTRDNLEKQFSLKNSDIVENNLNNSQIDSCTSRISSVGQSCVDDYELCSENTRRKCSDESDPEMKSDGTVLCINDQELNEMQRQKCSTSGTSLIPVDKTNPPSQGNTVVSSDKLVNLSTCASQIANSIESNSVSENRSVSKNISSSEEPRLSGEGIDNLGSSKKHVQSDLALSSWTDADIPVEKKSTSRNVQEALPTIGHNDKHLVKELEFSGIQNILDEIQKENKEYGSLLDCHKNIINYLEGITKMQPEEMHPDSAEWLHKQLIMLSQKLHDTKEKQSIQIASINRLVKHQRDLMKSDDNENNMTIEMQYLRNIIFQYMIGKETMLLAKVISAVMKFDQQQMDEVMQKELQKQTLLGQLGLL